jgi:hypothetical protein
LSCARISSALDRSSCEASLPLDLVDDPVRRFPLPLQVGQLVVDVVDLALQPALLLLQTIPLRPDDLKSALAFLQVRSSLSRS